MIAFVMSIIATLAKVLAGLVLLALLILVVQIYRNSGNDALVEKSGTDLRVASYNVHYIVVRRATGPWSMADWERRKGPLVLEVSA
ncbi:MAG: hypothetical protein AAF583_09270 [Pseudomonadota bacterium]